jgi:hypothetical protein
MNILTSILSGLQLLSGLVGIFIDPANKKWRWIFITLLLLIFGATMVSDVRDAALQQQENDKQEQEKKRTDRKLDSLLEQNSHLTAMIAQAIGYYGTTKSTVTVSEIQRSVDADVRLRTLQRSAVPVRSAIRVEYFIKDVDRDIISSVLRKLGFQVQIMPPVNEYPTNHIWVGNNVTLQETKRLAFTLIRAGVELRAIGRFHDGGGARANLIQVGADPAIRTQPVLTVAQIEALQHL